MHKEENERLAGEIAGHLKDRFGITVCDAATAIDKGFLNVKWKMPTDQGLMFVKYYHPERYKLHLHPDRRNKIERTLRFQQEMNASGIPCPRVLSFEGRHLQQTPSGCMYTVMEWVNGRAVEAGHMSAAQMFELGLGAGRMHRWLQSVPLSDSPGWKPDKEAYLRQWRINREQAKAAGDPTVLEWLERSHSIVEPMDFRCFESCRTGWLHWDLWVDNILFNERRLAGIVDFDRMEVAYPEIDLARAVLSGTLRDGELRLEAVRAFMEGYREHAYAPRGTLARAMSMIYLIESIWWLRTEVRKESGLRRLLGRFIEEMHWLEDHWADLPAQLESV
ncbi:phosphotransferase enzyme family protein [Paenibacillus humicola]|uniref:phosphotransferase enzyme family protein n=1 Tax=Paenibacillus humicola TaxID=3110540 RepID=UPI00237BBC15|nr:phosphotransferase [Paenibacillus humicola]